MALKFKANWADEIAEVTESKEYQTALIRIRDASVVETSPAYDEDTHTWSPGSGDSTVYVGQARIIGVRWGVFTGGESQANATTITGIRVQIPYGDDADAGYGEEAYGDPGYGIGDTPGRVKRGSKVFVEAAPDNPALVGLIFNVTSDLQGASAASRTFECALDQDVALV